MGTTQVVGISQAMFTGAGAVTINYHYLALPVTRVRPGKFERGEEVSVGEDIFC